MTLAGIDPTTGRLTVPTTMTRMTPLRRGLPVFEHAVVVGDESPSWQVTMEGVQTDGRRVAVVPRELDATVPALLGYEVTLAYSVLDTLSLRSTASRAAGLLTGQLAGLAGRIGSDGWALEAWTPVQGEKWAYLGAPWLSRCRLDLRPSLAPQTNHEAPRYEVRAFSGITRPTSLQWPDDAPPVLREEDGSVRPMRIEPHMHFTCDLTVLAPPAQ
ncbi:hypothetical protein ABZT26_35320 [Streptomyces sp. NPDC005395]|uniref:hypothetical protein n=1 Tax=Streptomyces sp. NPDC005395 TaxID=3157042 RepID=UPI0033A9C33A